MNPLFHTEFSISDSLKNVRKSVLIYETIIKFVTKIENCKNRLPNSELYEFKLPKVTKILIITKHKILCRVFSIYLCMSLAQIIHNYIYSTF